ncbi:MAG: coenzyme F420-0:L-glutamate ligase [Candidatus Bathyarchaeia archaeon]
MSNIIQIIGIKGLPIIKEGDNLAELICKAAEMQGTPIQNGDIIIVTHVAVSRAEGRIVNLDEVKPSQFASYYGELYGRDPALIEVILREAKNVIRMVNGKIITETKQGFICANSGVDKSNVPGERVVALLPVDPDASARRIREDIMRITGKDVAVIISDTHGRPFREGEINVAIGVAGIEPIRDRRGDKDLFGYILRVKRTAIADELASAAELVIGQGDEGIPAAIIRGYEFTKSETATAKELIRPKERDLFL